ncbi:E3 ubiquitin-protein ligase RMND5A [Pseudolycoriella hygida]|uniref:E3 ubiquitin-protein ligase RMND5A n=1 Tax=Pseudolycoriella hygida TaxID=35572 RepID=A0A9Q0NAW9_9DIPT|nr:E3 ubiquitin-protein ligase RMND5A [Pseudolycoriella hygida]
MTDNASEISKEKDCCMMVDVELTKVLDKFTAMQGHTNRVLSDVTASFEGFQAALNEVPPDGNLSFEQHALLRDLLAKSREKLRRLTTDHRDIHTSVSKVGKTIDRNFISDLSLTTKSDVMLEERNVHLLNKVIAQHFYRQGKDDIADTLVKEANLSKDEFTQEPFAELHSIWECIQNKNIQPALEWASRYSKELMEKNSTLEFKLHRLAYMQILSKGINAQTEALKYARTHFAKFVNIFQKDIQILMGALMYLPVGIDNSPYRTLIEPKTWTEAADTFLKDACHTLGIIKESPLSIVASAGCIALPALLNIKQAMRKRQVPELWSERDELPIEIELEPEHRYHSSFTCPILRQLTSEDNPPMKLTCGHVISRDALSKLSNGTL